MGVTLGQADDDASAMAAGRAGFAGAAPLAENGFNGKVLIDAKKWDLWDTALRPATNRTRAGEWAYQITQTWKGMTAGGLARFGGVSFGESNPDNRDWGKPRASASRWPTSRAACPRAR